jgi:hypothetical protein
MPSGPSGATSRRQRVAKSARIIEYRGAGLPPGPEFREPSRAAEATMRRYVIAIDLDNTLLDSDGGLAERNRAAIHAAHTAGHRVVVCTGRSYAETRPVLEMIGLDLDAAVTVGGGHVVDLINVRTMSSTRMSAELTRETVSWFRQRDFTVVWAHDPFEHGFDGYLIQGARQHPAIERWFEMAPADLRVVTDQPEGGQRAIRVNIVDDDEVLRKIAVDFVARFDGRISYHVIRVPQYRIAVLEAFDRSVSKWTGVLTLCEAWGIDPRDTIAFGDDVNDIALLRAAGRGIAVANAHADVLAVVDETTGSNDACGVAEVLEQLLIGERT